MTKPTEQQRQPAFDHDRGYSGQDYDVAEERRLAEEQPAGSVAPPTGHEGRRAAFDPATGEVRGSGMGAGGGSPGEDPDDDSAGGDGPVITGAQPDKPAN